MDAHDSEPIAATELTPDERAEAKRYGRIGLACDLLDRAIDVAYLSVAAFLLAGPLEAWLGRLTLLGDHATLRLIALLLIVTAAHAAVSFPLSFYSGHVLEHRFGLSRQTFGGWFVRYLKRMALALAFGAVLYAGLFWLIWLTGPWWWIVAAGAFFLVSVVLGQLAPVLIMPLFYKIQRLDRPDLVERMAGLTKGTGLSIEGVYRMDMSQETAKANAMLAGLGRTRRVILGDTLLNGFSLDEIEVVFAHEVGHHVHGHLRKLLLAGIVYSAAGFWVCDRLLAAWVGASGGPFSYAALPVASLPLIMLILTLFSFLVEPIQNAVSRRYERQSDRYALKHLLDRSGDAAAFVSAFQKLARLNKDDPDPHWLETLLFHGHPPIAQRLAMAESAGSFAAR